VTDTQAEFGNGGCLSDIDDRYVAVEVDGQHPELAKSQGHACASENVKYQ